MGKLSKLVLAGLGAYAVKYYIDNPKKADEHKEILKEKFDNSVAYSKCMWNYTQKNGVAASAEYIKNDLERVVKKITGKVENTVEFGKQFASDSSTIKEHATGVKDKGIELKNNLSDASKVITEEILPKVTSYVDEVKNYVTNLNSKTSEIKNTIESDNVQEKISNYQEKVATTVEDTKTTVSEVTGKDLNKEEPLPE